MKRFVLLTVVASPLLASCGATTTRTVTKVVPVPVYFEGAAGGPQQMPATLALTADGSLIVTGVQWTSWGGPVATGSGNAAYHGCAPSCGAAPVNMALVSIRLSGTRTCAGRSYYAGLTLTLNSGQLLDEQFLQRSWSPC